jgi:hypothetical protein
MTEKKKTSSSQPHSASTSAARAPAKEPNHDDLPAVSKQTAGGIAGATLGAVLAGPVGAILGGVAGALVGDASAAGKRPIERTVENIRAVAEPPARRAYARISKAMSHHKASTKKAPGSSKKPSKAASK